MYLDLLFSIFNGLESEKNILFWFCGELYTIENTYTFGQFKCFLSLDRKIYKINMQ